MTTHKLIRLTAAVLLAATVSSGTFATTAEWSPTVQAATQNIKLNEKSIEILELIKDYGILNIDEICDNTKMEVKYINAILNELVLKDLLIEMNNQVYSLNI